MATENNQLSPEQEELFLTQGIESSRFLRAHKDFKVGQKNADQMGQLLKAEGLEWIAENLEKIFVNNRDKFELQKPKERPAPPVDPPPVPPAPQEPEWGWLTKASIASMAPEAYKHYYNHKNEAVQREFRRQVTNVAQGLDQLTGRAI